MQEWDTYASHGPELRWLEVILSDHAPGRVEHGVMPVQARHGHRPGDPSGGAILVAAGVGRMPVAGQWGPTLEEGRNSRTKVRSILY